MKSSVKGANTYSRNGQGVPGGSVAPERLTLLDPEIAVMLPPPHDPVKPFGVATTRPVGKVSVKATPVSATVLALAIAKRTLVVPLDTMRAAPNDFVSE